MADERKDADDLIELMRAAGEALAQALKDGRDRYGAGDWLTRPMEHHLQHAAVHVQELTSPAEDVLSADQLERDLAHLVCRAVMAWAKQKP